MTDVTESQRRGHLDGVMFDSLKNIARWGRITGWIMMILGILSALGGLFAFVIGAVPGIITFFLGLYLKQSGDKASELIRTMNEETLVYMIKDYAKYLKVQGIYMIVSFVLVFLVYFILFVSFGFAAFNADTYQY